MLTTRYLARCAQEFYYHSIIFYVFQIEVILVQDMLQLYNSKRWLSLKCTNFDPI